VVGRGERQDRRSALRFDILVDCASLSVQDGKELLPPTELTLGPAYPNPFNEIVNIGFELPTPGEVALTIHDQTGRAIRTLVKETLNVGRYQGGVERT